jgi:hypothetical protein
MSASLHRTECRSRPSVSAEDALHILRRFFEGISAAAGGALANLDIQVITAPTLRLDLD